MILFTGSDQAHDQIHFRLLKNSVLTYVKCAILNFSFFDLILLLSVAHVQNLSIFWNELVWLRFLKISCTFERDLLGLVDCRKSSLKPSAFLTLELADILRA